MQAKTSVTLSLDEATLRKLGDFYAGSLLEPSSPYIILEAESEDCHVAVYSKKDKEGKRKVVFQGKKAEYEASIFGYVKEEEPKGKDGAPKSMFPQIGSDEVGTGDFFGPVIVVGAYVEKKDLPYLKELGVTDSKKLSDEQILVIGKSLINRIDYSSLSLDNPKYNEVHEQGLNMNAIKAKMHNAVLLNLKRKHRYAHAYIDQFAEPGVYFSYLKNEKEVLMDLNFSVKGELHYVSVAAASIIARYSFLRKMEAIGEKYGVTIPLGAGPVVDEFAKEFAAKYGIDELRSICKANFANFKKAI